MRDNAFIPRFIKFAISKILSFLERRGIIPRFSRINYCRTFETGYRIALKRIGFIFKKVKFGKDLAQTFVEYALLFGVVAAIFIALTPLIRRTSQAMIKLTADQVGFQVNAEQIGGRTGKLEEANILTGQRRSKNTRELGGGITKYSFDSDEVDISSNTISNLGFTEKR